MEEERIDFRTLWYTGTEHWARREVLDGLKRSGQHATTVCMPFLTFFHFILKRENTIYQIRHQSFLELCFKI